MKNRINLLFMMGVVAAALLTGCGSSAEEKETAVTAQSEETENSGDYSDDEEYADDPDENSAGISDDSDYDDEEYDAESDDEEDDDATSSDEELERCPDYVREISAEPGKLTFSTVDINGDSFTSEDIEDYNLVLFNFFESWCGPCVSELSTLENIYEDYKDKGVLLVGVYWDPDYSNAETGLGPSDREELQDILSENNVSYPIIAYSEDFDEYSAHTYRPSSIFTDGDGNVYGPSEDELMYAFGVDDPEVLAEAMEDTPAGSIPGALGDLFRLFINDRLD